MPLTWEYAKPGIILLDLDSDRADNFYYAAIIQDNNHGVLIYVPKMHTS